MNALSLPAPAKLNLFLHILGRRADGYHELQTAYRMLDFCDTVHVAAEGAGIEMAAPTPGVMPERDLALHAARALARAAGVHVGARIRVDKRIPAGAGLGGGSSDAAAVLTALNRLWGLDYAPAELAAIGLELGADVPVFIHGCDAWGEGIGERLSPLALKPAWYVVVIPDVHVDTAGIFADPALRRDRAAVSPQQWLAAPAECVNDCMPVVSARFPQVAAAVTETAKYGSVRMSGTGSALFLEFGRAADAAEVGKALADRYNVLVTHAPGTGWLGRSVGAAQAPRRPDA